MQLAAQSQVHHDPSRAESAKLDYTPSGVYPLGHVARKLTGLDDEPFIVVHQLSDIEAAQVALLEQELAEQELDREPASADDPATDADDPDHTFELGPATVDVKLPIVGTDWEEDEETTRFMRGVPVLLPRAFETSDLRAARRMAADLELGATAPTLPAAGASPWCAAPWRNELPLTSSRTDRTWREWLLIAALTFAAEAALLAGMALAFG